MHILYIFHVQRVQRAESVSYFAGYNLCLFMVLHMLEVEKMEEKEIEQKIRAQKIHRQRLHYSLFASVTRDASNRNGKPVYDNDVVVVDDAQHRSYSFVCAVRRSKQSRPAQTPAVVVGERPACRG